MKVIGKDADNCHHEILRTHIHYRYLLHIVLLYLVLLSFIFLYGIVFTGMIYIFPFPHLCFNIDVMYSGYDRCLVFF